MAIKGANESEFNYEKAKAELLERHRAEKEALEQHIQFVLARQQAERLASAPIVPQFLLANDAQPTKPRRLSHHLRETSEDVVITDELEDKVLGYQY